MWKKHGIQVYFKGDKTIKDLLVAPKDKDHITKKSNMIYRFKCDGVECDEEYIGESSKIFGDRFKEHLKPPSPNIWPFQHHRSYYYTAKFQYNAEGGPKPHEAYKRSNLHKDQQSIPKQKHSQIPSASHMGWGSVQHLRTQNKINKQIKIWPSG